MATGLGKCVDPNTWVWSGGLWRFGEIFNVAERIAAPAGPAVVSDWYDDGIREGHKVTLDCGLVIDGTPAHRVWVRNPDGYEGWRYLGELADDDRIAVGRDRADFGSSSIPLDEAYALGLLIADGSLVDHGTTRRLQIDKQGPVLLAVLPVMERWRTLAGARWGSGTSVTEFSEKHAVATSYAPNFHAMLRERYGIEQWTYSESREVPPVVLTGTRDVVVAFLKGYFDGDGYCSPAPAISTSSPVLAEQVHMMLLGLGIFATHKVKETPCLPSHEIAVWDYDAFARTIGFTPYGLKKDRCFAALMSKPRNTNKDTVPGVGGLIHSIARRIKGKRKCGNEWRLARSYYSGEKMPGYDMLKAWYASAPDCPERDELGRIIADHYAWSPIRSIEPSTIRRIDCQVEEQHAFIGNGIVNHNTVSFGMVARMVAEKGGRTLVLAHRGELIEQAAETLTRIGLDPGIEKANSFARAIYEPNVVVATVQTMQGDRLQTWPKDFFKLVIVDECHHSTAKSYRNVLDHFSGARVLGVTATAERTDDGALGDVFESVAYEYTLWEAMTAPAPGPYLSRLRFVQCDVGIDLRDIRTTAGDLNAADLEEAIRPHIETLANAIKQEIGDRKTLAFTPDVGSAMAMATALDSIGIRSRWVSGESPDRKAIIDGFKRGDFQALANCLDEKTEILTLRGWIGCQEIRDTDITASFNRRTGEVNWEPIQAIIKRDRQPDERMVTIRNQTLDIRVTEGHRMVVRTKGAKQWIVAEAGTLPGRIAAYQIPMAGLGEPDWDVFFPDGTKPPGKLTLDECKFIGLWIADGHIDRTGGSRGVKIGQSNRYPEANKEIRRILDSCGFDWKHREYAVCATINIPTRHTQHEYRVPKGNITGSLERRGYCSLEAYLDKDLSPLLNGLDRDQFKALVEGLWLGDGVKAKHRKPRRGVRTGWNIVNTNRTMLDRLQIMAVTRGFACNLSRPRDNGPRATKPIYTIGIRDRSYVTTNNKQVETSGGNPASFEEAWKPEMVWCVTNATGTIITRRNGKVAVMGQCSLLLEGFDAPDVSAIALLRPTKSRPLYTQIVGRGTRLAPHKENCLLIDFAWLTAKHDLVKPTELFGSTACDPETAAIADEVMKAKKGMDLHDVIEEAKEEKRRRTELRIKAEQRELKYRKVAYDPLTQMGVLGLKVPKSATSNQGTVTGYQRERLERWGFKDVESMSKSQASRVIDQYGQRLRRGLATMKQVGVLIRNGMPAEEARAKTIREASDLIDVIFNGPKAAPAPPVPSDEEPMTWVA